MQCMCFFKRWEFGFLVLHLWHTKLLKPNRFSHLILNIDPLHSWFFCLSRTHNWITHSGPANDALKKLESIFPGEMGHFKKDRHIKSSGPGWAYNMAQPWNPSWPTAMESLMTSKTLSWKMAWGRNVSHLINLNALNSAVNAKVLDLQKVKEIIAIDELRENFFHVYKQNLTCLKPWSSISCLIISWSILSIFRGKNMGWVPE